MIPSLTSENANTARSWAIAMSAVGDEARAAAERMALDEGDHRRGAGVDRVEHAAQRVGVGDVLVVGEVDRLPHPLDVGAGAEARALAGEDDRPRLADVDECLRQLGDRGRVERVARLGPGEGDPEDVVVPLDPQRVHAARQSRVAPCRSTAIRRRAPASRPARNAGGLGDAAPPGRSRARRGGVRPARRALRRRRPRRRARVRHERRGSAVLGRRSAGAGCGCSSRPPPAGSTSPRTAVPRRPPTRSRSPPTRRRRARPRSP